VRYHRSFFLAILQKVLYGPRNCQGAHRIMDDDKSAKQLIDVEILYLLREGSETLYSVRKDLADVFAEDRSFGTIHPHLLKLEEEGLIKGLETRSNDSGPYKRPYVLTRKGRSTLEKQVNRLTKTVLKLTV
jgi:DNA-binding PadR family transcriptional regulator